MKGIFDYFRKTGHIEDEPTNISRRDFLKKTGMATAGVAAGIMMPGVAEAGLKVSKKKIPKLELRWINDIEDPLLKRLYNMILNGIDIPDLDYSLYRFILFDVERFDFEYKGKILKISEQTRRDEPLFHILAEIIEQGNLNKFSAYFSWMANRGPTFRNSTGGEVIITKIGEYRNLNFVENKEYSKAYYDAKKSYYWKFISSVPDMGNFAKGFEIYLSNARSDTQYRSGVTFNNRYNRYAYSYFEKAMLIACYGDKKAEQIFGFSKSSRTIQRYYEIIYASASNVNNRRSAKIVAWSAYFLAMMYQYKHVNGEAWRNGAGSGNIDKYRKYINDIVKPLEKKYNLNITTSERSQMFWFGELDIKG